MKVNNSMGLANYYEYYKENVECPVRYKIYAKVVKQFFSIVVKVMMEESLTYLMPHNLGIVGIIKKKRPNVVLNENNEIDIKKSHLIVDYKSTKELWKEQPETKNKTFIYFENDHTNGEYVKIKWIPGLVQNRTAYTFIPCRAFKRTLAKYIKNNPNTNYYDF